MALAEYKANSEMRTQWGVKHKGQLPYKLTFNDRKRLASKGTYRHVKVLCGAMGMKKRCRYSMVCH